MHGVCVRHEIDLQHASDTYILAVQAEEEQGKADKAEKAASRRLALLASAAPPASQEVAAGANPCDAVRLLLHLSLTFAFPVASATPPTTQDVAAGASLWNAVGLLLHL